jgi:hypothetical protein
MAKQAHMGRIELRRNVVSAFSALLVCAAATFLIAHHLAN